MENNNVNNNINNINSYKELVDNVSILIKNKNMIDIDIISYIKQKLSQIKNISQPNNSYKNYQKQP